MVSFCPSRGYCSYSVHSWSPPSGAAPAISIDTGFSMAMSKVFFFLFFFCIRHSHSAKLCGFESVSIRSESTQLPSEL